MFTSKPEHGNLLLCDNSLIFFYIKINIKVATELPTYEEAQALSLNPSSFKFKPTIPKSPPPAWSPINNNTQQSSESPVTIHDCDNPTSGSEIQSQQPPIYQLFARTSPNQIQRK